MFVDHVNNCQVAYLQITIDLKYSVDPYWVIAGSNSQKSSPAVYVKLLARRNYSWGKRLMCENLSICNQLQRDYQL